MYSVGLNNEYDPALSLGSKVFIAFGSNLPTVDHVSSAQEIQELLSQSNLLGAIVGQFAQPMGWYGGTEVISNLLNPKSVYKIYTARGQKSVCYPTPKEIECETDPSQVIRPFTPTSKNLLPYYSLSGDPIVVRFKYAQPIKLRGLLLDSIIQSHARNYLPTAVKVRATVSGEQVERNMVFSFGTPGAILDGEPLIADEFFIELSGLIYDRVSYLYHITPFVDEVDFPKVATSPTRITHAYVFSMETNFPWIVRIPIGSSGSSLMDSVNISDEENCLYLLQTTIAELR